LFDCIAASGESEAKGESAMQKIFREQDSTTIGAAKITASMRGFPSGRNNPSRYAGGLLQVPRHECVVASVGLPCDVEDVAEEWMAPMDTSMPRLTTSAPALRTECLGTMQR